MNFHKTIGFLATLLLTLGLGVPNSFAQTVDLSFNPPSMNEGGELAVGKLVVSVTLDAEAAAATTVTVTLVAADAGNTINLATAGVGVGLALDVTPVEVAFAKGMTSKTVERSFTYAPPQDGPGLTVVETIVADETYVIFGSHTGTVTQTGNNASPSAKFTVIDDEVGVDSVSLMFDPASMNEGDGVTVGKLVVSVMLEANAAAATTVAVTLAAATTGNDIDLATTGAGVSDDLDLAVANVVIAKGMSSGKVERAFSYDPQEDDATTTPAEAVVADETYVVFGSHEGTPVQTGNNASPKATFTVIDNEVAVDAVTLAFDPMSMNEGDGVTVGKLVVSVMLDANATAATTVAVTLAAADAGNTINLATAGDGVSDALDLAVANVVIAKGMSSGKVERAFSYDPQEDDATTTPAEAVVADETYVVFGSHEGTPVQTGNNASPKATFTVIDNEVAVDAVTLAFDPMSMNEGGNLAVGKLVVSVMLEAPATVATTVAVNLTTVAADNTIDLGTAGDGVGLALDVTTVANVVINKDASSGKVERAFSYAPPQDATPADEDPAADETYVVYGSTGTPVTTGPAKDRSPSAKFTVIDDDKPVPGAVTGIAFSPATLELTEEMAFTATVTVTVSAAKGTAQTVDVALSATGAALSDLVGTNTTVSVPIDAATKATSGTATVAISYTPPDGDYTADDGITITGMGGGQSGTLTLNIADNDVGALTGVSFDPAMIDFVEGTEKTATVTVTVEAMAGAAQTVMVSLSSDTSLPLGTINSPIAVSIDANAESGSETVSITYMPPQDDDSDDEMIVITGTANAGMTDEQEATLTLNVADDEMGAVTSVSFDPDMLSLTEGTAFTQTVTVTVGLAAGSPNAIDVVLSATGATLTDLGLTSPVSIAVPRNATSVTAPVTVSYTPPTDADLHDETVVITGTVTVDAGMPTEIVRSGTLTLNVDDNTVSKGTITVKTSLESIRENSRTRNVVVTAELDAAPSTGTTVMVTVDVTGGETPVQVQIPIVGPATSNTATVAITPVNDEVFSTKSFTVTGSVTGYRSGMAMIDIVDDDTSDGTLSITSLPPSATLNGGAQTLAVKVTVWLATPDIPIPNPLVVNVTTDKGTFPNGQKTTTVEITNIRKHPDHDPATRRADGNKSVNLSLAAGDVTAAGNITVTASVDKYETGTREIPIRARGALDVAGYRAVISKPTGTAWANIGNDKIFVDVTRHANVAYPWGDFGSINVSVRDTAHADFELEEVTASGFNRESNGAVTFQEPGSASRGDVIWRGNDTIRFEIRIRAHSTYDSQERAANGQYLGAYAHVEFVSGQETAVIETRDDETSVYPADPSLVSDAKVGDGRLIRIDNLAPAHSGVEAVRVTSGDEADGNIDATVGDEIRVAVKLSQTNLFRESGLRIQLQVVDGKGSVRGQTLTAAQRNNPSKNKDFSTSQVIAAAAADDSMFHTYTVTEGYFTVTLDDFVEGVGAKGTSLDLNSARAQVRAGVKDQAGNYKFSGWTQFDIDSRSPSVSILYPSADPDSLYDHTPSMHFSGDTESVVEGQNQDAHLNPLRISFDEALSEIKVYAVGADTLSTEEASNSLRHLRYFNFAGGSIGEVDSVIVNTMNLSSPKKDGEGDDDKYPGTAFVPSSANRAGTEIELAILATDMLGNTTKMTMSGVTHDASQPVITDWFPKNSLLPEDQINDATPPIFTLPEDVDSIAVTFEGSDGSDVVKERGGATKGEESIDFSGALTDDVSYDMMIFVRDLAGNVFITPADSSSNMKFNAQFDNPVANRFNVSAGMDSVIAGQANMLTLQAEDHDSGSNTTRNALTYKNAVRISAWDTGGGAAESVWFEGDGVTDDADSPDGVAMLNAGEWKIGKRSVTVKSNKATGFIKILVQHVTSGQGDTAVLGFEGAKDSIYVGAADFAGFEITAWEEGFEGAVDEIWGDYTLRVVPTDRHGNASVRAFKTDPSTAEDSLAVLDTRAKDNAFDYKDGVGIEIVGVPTIEDFALLVLSIGMEGASYDLVAPDNRRSQTVQVRVAPGNWIDDGDTRSQNIRSTARFVISAPLTPVLTVWVEGMEGDQAGNDIVVPATVTVAAEGYNAGDMVTFTQNGQVVGTLEANDEGVATAPAITVPVASTATVSATNGRYATGDLTITFVDAPAEPARKSYVDANGDPVYLIYTGDAPSDMTVGVDDFLALVAAFMSSMDDANYNAQADVDDDGDVDVADFVEFVTSFGRTAVGPATKPLVLAPGINENAEFSLSLGSDRVVAGELVAVDVSLANVAALMGYGFALSYETDKFEFVSVTPADEDLLKSTGGETLFHHIVSDGQVTVANGLYNGTAVSGGGDVVQFVFRVLREFEDNARFEIADGLVFDPSQLSNPAVVAGVLELQSTPREFALHQNFPNPFNPDTTIKYDLAESADVTLQIYNVLGQVIRTLVASEAQNAGRYQIRWNGMDDRGVPVSSGIYFYQISADGKFSDVRKLMLLK